MRAERLLVICRDVAFLTVGIGGITYQQVTGRVSELLLAVYVGLLGVPAGLGVLSLRRADPGTDTNGSSSSSPDPSPRPPSSSPSPAASTGGDR